MRKKTKRIFDDIIIGLKGKDALACLESLEKSRRISCRTGIPLKGSRRRLTAIPCVTGSFTKASAISGVLLSLTLHYRKK